MNREYIFENIDENDYGDYNIIKLDEISDEEKEIMNPLVPPTSGLRMEIFEIENTDDKEIFTLTKKKLFHFLRIMKGIAVIAKKELNNKQPSILIVTDDRPSADTLLDFASRIFTQENYKIYHQRGEGEQTPGTPYIRGKSKMSTPYASASVILFDQIDVVLMLTASHNPLKWNGLKFYIERPIPISGGVMQAVSEHALSLHEIEIAKSYNAELIDADKVNNDYIMKLVKRIVNLDVLRDKKIIMWPFLGTAPEIKSLLESCGAKITLIYDPRDPPDPTKGFDKSKIEALMKEQSIKFAVMLDADRDRLVFLIYTGDHFYELTPNELYTAMHNILSDKMGKKIINVRTTPSDPRSDRSAKINFITGVGYKHLGILQYLAANMEVPQSQLQTGILYYLKDNKYIKLRNKEDIERVIIDSKLTGELIFVLWEESGGHTFNIFNSEISDGALKLISDFPVMGDKYPAPAILVVSSLLEMGYDLKEYIDQTMMGDNISLPADDEEKLKYMKYLTGFVGKTMKINRIEYSVGSFTEISDKLATIYLISGTTAMYIRPSGTGPHIKIYVFGSHKTYLEEMNAVANYIKSIQI